MTYQSFCPPIVLFKNIFTNLNIRIYIKIKQDSHNDFY